MIIYPCCSLRKDFPDEGLGVRTNVKKYLLYLGGEYNSVELITDFFHPKTKTFCRYSDEECQLFSPEPYYWELVLGNFEDFAILSQ